MTYEKRQARKTFRKYKRSYLDMFMEVCLFGVVDSFGGDGLVFTATPMQASDQFRQILSILFADSGLEGE